MELVFALALADASWSTELAAVLPLLEPPTFRILRPRNAELLREEGVRLLDDRIAIRGVTEGLSSMP